jgi:hypothetical protein
MVCHRVQPGTPAISYKLITTQDRNGSESLGLPQLADPFYGSTAIRQYGTALRQ